MLRSSINTNSFNTEGNYDSCNDNGSHRPSGRGPKAMSGLVLLLVRIGLGDPNSGNGGDIVITSTVTNVTFTGAHLDSAADGLGGFGRKGGDIRISGAQSILLDNGTHIPVLDK